MTSSKNTNSSVTLFIGNLSIGGAERVTVNLANQLAENGHHVEVLVVTDDGELADELVPAVEQSVLSVNRMRWAAIPLARHLRRTLPDALISFMTAANVMAIAAAKLSRVSAQIIVTEHNTQTQKSSLSVKRDMFLAKHSYQFADHIVGVSNGVTEDIAQWANVSEDRLTTIYNPVVTEDLITGEYPTPEHEWFTDENISVVLTAGRHVEQKDHPTLLRAFAELHSEQEHTRLVVLGEGSLTAEYQKLAVELGIEDVTLFPGFVDDPYPYMANADVFALSSRWEGLSLVLIEAMACGTPVVSTDCPSGPSEVLANGEFGELVEVGEPGLLKSALVRALLDPINEELLRKRARDFSVNKAATEYENFW